MPYIDVFRTMFPEGAGYEHDKIDRRTELTDAQKPEEPQNADSHLAFMAGALRTCVSYRNRVDEPVCFIDLDGVHAGRPRRRRTTVLGYSARGAGRADAHRRARLAPRRGFGEPEGSQPGHLRAVRRAGGRARRDQGTHPSDAGAGRAARRPDRQRVRDAADAPRPVARCCAIRSGSWRRRPGTCSATRARSRPRRSTTRSTTSSACSTSSSMRSGCTNRWSRASCRARSRCRPPASCG